MNSLVGEMAGVLFLLDFEVPPWVLLLEVAKLHGNIVRLSIAADVAESRAGDDQRGSRLIDENVIHFVDDGKVERLLALLSPRRIIGIGPPGGLHVVAQVIE